MPIQQPTSESHLAAVRDELLTFLRERLPETTNLDIESELVADGLLDSVLIMDLLGHIEAIHGPALSGADVSPRNFRSVAAVAELVVQRQS